MTLGMDTLRPGDLMFTTIEGIGGKLIGLAEKVNDPVVTWDDARRVQHVGVVTDGLALVQAMPGGAQYGSLTGDYWTPEFIYVRPRYPSRAATLTAPSWMMGEDVADAACNYVGVPYSFLDYAAIAGRHMLIKKPADRTWLDRYVTSTKHMICSQLADQALSDAGFHVFNDDRLPQDVTPAALYRQLLRLPGQFYIVGFDGWRACGPGTAYA